MKILNRKEFLKLEGEWVFFKYPSGKLQIKTETIGDSFAAQPLTDIENTGCIDQDDKLFKMQSDPSFEVDISFDCSGFDGDYDDRFFALLSDKDVVGMINRLNEVINEKKSKITRKRR